MSQAIEKLASRTVRGRRTDKAKLPPPKKPPEGNSIVGINPAGIEPERRHEWIAQAAYFRAERRAFEPGFELEDWCAAEQEIDQLLARGDFRG
jgi:Protein of unknown function (DUF2934)